MSNDSYDFLGISGKSGAPYFPFHEPGTTITGKITAEPVQRDKTEPGTNKVMTYSDGNPQKVLVVTLQTSLVGVNGSDDDGLRSLWVSTIGQKRALADAVRAAGKEGLDVGGTLTMTFTGYGERSAPGLNPMKVFEASYTPPNASSEFIKTVAPQTNSGSDDPLGNLSPEARAALANLVSKS